MALTLYHSDGTTSPTWEIISIGTSALKIVDIRLAVSYSHPARLTFACLCPQQERPIHERAEISFVDSDHASGDITTPVFEGHVYEVKPVGANRVEYVCYDQTMRARQQVTIMSGPNGDPASIPRLVYNSKIDNDDDRAFELRHDASVGQMLRDILTHPYNELVSLCSAAPPPVIGGGAFMDADVNALTFIPQEKMVFESQKIGSGIDRLLDYYPTHRVIFVPGLGTSRRKWRIIDTTISPTVDITLGKWEDYKVLSFGIERSMEGRATAVEIKGPPQASSITTVYQQAPDSGTGSATVSTGLTKAWTVQEELNLKVLGTHAPQEAYGYAARRWQIADATKRKIARILPEELLVSAQQWSPDWFRNINASPLVFKKTRQPFLEVTFDGLIWWYVQGVTLDLQNGYIIAPFPITQFGIFNSSNPPNSSVQPEQIGEFLPPLNARFTYCYLVPGLSSRFPSSGYSGQAYTESGLEVVERIYDEMYALNYEVADLASEAARVAEYDSLAEAIHKSLSAVTYAGGFVLSGIDYDWRYLNTKVNFPGWDEGSSLTTGWEAIEADVSEVEFDYTKRLTTVQYGTEAAEAAGREVDRIRESLKIKAEENAQRAEEIKSLPTITIQLGTIDGLLPS